MIARVLPQLFVRAALFVLLSSCALFTSFDDYGTSSSKRQDLFSVRGTVSGFDGRRVELLVNETLLIVPHVHKGNVWDP